MSQRKWFLIITVYMGLLAILSLSPQEHPEGAGFNIKEIVHNVGHIPAYSILCYLWVQCLGAINSKNFIIAAIATLAFGIAMEYFQSFVPGRFASLTDIGSDTLGIIIALVYLKNFSKSIWIKN